MVHESIRVANPVTYMRRTTKVDTQIGDQKIGPNEKISLWYGAANRDPEIFENPDKYDIRRENAKKHLDGGGQFVDDLTLPRMVHVAFLRSPFAHAEIKSINTNDAKKSDGVIDVFTAKEIDEVCKPWIGTLGH